MPDAPTTPTPPARPSVEPSRAWILGLVVEPDGAVSGPATVRVLEWPDCECPDDCAIDHENA